MIDWPAHWGLNRDPFRERDRVYVGVASQGRALARLLDGLDAAEPIVDLAGEPGIGKSRLLDRALLMASQPNRRIVRIHGSAENDALPDRILEKLGRGHSERSWRDLERRARIHRGLGETVVVAIDEAHRCEPEAVERLGRIDPSIVVVQVILNEQAASNPWRWTCPLPPWGFSEAVQYLAEKLRSAGGSLPAILPETAIGALHAWSSGTPRGLNRLAAAALDRAARRGESSVSAALVEEVARDYLDLAA